jgi:uncharacterized UPF0160 family protein
MKKFKVKVTNSGIIFLPSGRKVRTPVELNINEKDLNAYKVQFKAKGLTYKIVEVTEDGFDNQNLPSISKRVIIEELAPLNTKTTAEPKTFLDKLISDEEN